MSFSIIAAVGKNGEIGINGRLPWRIPEDLKRFRELTRNHAVIMGRKTFESIGKPLPDRKNILITRKDNYSAPPECTIVNSLEEALRIAKDDPETFIIGGAEIYSQALPYVEKMYITAVDGEFPADTFFPKFDLSEWKITETSAGHRPESEPINFSFLVYERIRPA